MKRVLLCGSNGLLGQRLALMLGGQTEYEVLNTSHHRSFVFDDRLFDYTQLDLTRKGDVKSLISSFQPDVIINAAGLTNVDWCEEHREEAWKVNVSGVEHLVEGARRVGAKLVHVSTDYVFDGTKGHYSEEDRPNPVNYYGKTKLAGENAVRIADIPYVILRTIVLYGYGITVRDNFALWVIKNLRAGHPIRCAADQVANPTYVSDLAGMAVKAAESDIQGIFHIGGPEELSRYAFAAKIADLFGFDTALIERVETIQLIRKAARPLNSAFAIDKAGKLLGFRPMSIAEGIRQMQHELQTARRN